MPAGILHQLLAQAAGGDDLARERAFSELNRLLTIFVRSAMGSRLRDHRESADVCQSIARSFIQDHAGGAVRFENDAAVVGYLRTVVRTKLAMLARHDGALKRGGGSTPSSLDDDAGPFPADHAQRSAGESMAAREELERVRSGLSEQDQELARLRLAGMDWTQIADRLGRAPAALRKQWSRVTQRLMDESQGRD
jgi:RNA polymerase sigma factor (sigma-70 family)